MGCRKRFCRTFVPAFIRQRDWLQVLLLLVAVLLLGAALLVRLEAPYEVREASEYAALLRRLDYLVDEGHLNVSEVATLRKFCERTATAPQFDTMTDGDGDADDGFQANWSAVGGVWFMFTLVSTVGYGNFTPQTDAGRIAVVALGTVGIPLFGYLMILAGRELNEAVVDTALRQKCRRKKPAAAADGGIGAAFLSGLQQQQPKQKGRWWTSHVVHMCVLLATLGVGTLLVSTQTICRCLRFPALLFLIDCL